MPTYSYKCDNCDMIFQLILKMAEMDEPTQEPCPTCKHLRVRQLITPVAFGGEKIQATGGFKEVIQKIKEREPHNNLPDY